MNFPCKGCITLGICISKYQSNFNYRNVLDEHGCELIYDYLNQNSLYYYTKLQEFINYMKHEEYRKVRNKRE